MKVSFSFPNAKTAIVGIGAAVMLALNAALPAAAAASHTDLQEVEFVSDNGAHPNPERGFYLSAKHPLQDLKRRELRDAFAQDYRLLYVRIDLSGYKNRPLPDGFLRKLSRGFAAARNEGVKLIVRPVYNYPRGETDYQTAQDAPLEIVLKHIEQLSALMRENADVIAFIQAGYIGAWGEWHTSSNDLTSPAKRRRIMDAIIGSAPPERSVQFRYPPYIEEWIASRGAASDSAGIGFHNDCFLASDTDVGTYSEDAQKREEQRDAMAWLSARGPFGGETCNPLADPDPSPRSECADILREGARFGLTYLNAGYYRPLFYDRWEAGGCLDDVRNSMGYRLSLLRLKYPRVVEGGETTRIALTIANTGWAPPYNLKQFRLVLKNRESGAVLEFGGVNADPRAWLPGSESEVSIDLRIDDSVPPGTYEVYLALRDGAPTLAADPRYSVRFANADRADLGQEWDADIAAFRTGATIEVAE